ncbi:hypothetical protein JKP88DRAFT_328731 [Tribonema minus]|uniref:Uncharacterized protein n=1 Tax=Tribonema minus TaxID=303371 RepID=A0A836CC42_9STRA|nr:hypothetical protein JKP88DRAFT_328731 [Tribonema minus]
MGRGADAGTVRRQTARWMARCGQAFLWLYALQIAFHTVFLQSFLIGGTAGALPRMWRMMPDIMQPSDLAYYDNGAPFSFKYGQSPAGRYGHMLMALPWTVLAALQLDTNFRRRHSVAHRRMGYALLCTDVVMTIGILDVMVKKVAFSHVERHRRAVYARFAFIIAAFALSGAATVAYARRRDYASHKRAALHHIAVGHGVSTQRFLLILRGTVLGMRAATRNALCAGSPLSLTAEAEIASQSGGILGGFCATQGEGVLPQEQRQLMFGKLAFLGVLLNCALVEIWYAINPSMDPNKGLQPAIQVGHAAVDGAVT